MLLKIEGCETLSKSTDGALVITDASIERSMITSAEALQSTAKSGDCASFVKLLVVLYEGFRRCNSPCEWPMEAWR